MAVVELDELYAEIGSLAPRAHLLATASRHPRIIERRAELALRNGNPSETVRLLSRNPWQREHQRYVRGELWRAAQTALGSPDAPVPDFLNEDNLAQFGAYWSS